MANSLKPERICPDCRIPLYEIGMEGELVDRCPGCRGIFFDHGELESLIRIFQCFRSVTLREPEVESVPQSEIDRLVECPADGTPMNPVDVGGLVYDTCPTCQGVWLDAGEMAALLSIENHIRRNIGLYVRLGN